MLRSTPSLVRQPGFAEPRMNMDKTRYNLYIKIALVVVLFVAGASFGGYRYFSHDLPSTARLESIQPSLKTQVFAADSSLIGEYFEQNRALIPLEEIPDHMINAILAIEDRKFYSHWGLDMLGIMRALFKDLLAGEIVEGASTITQQLARNLFLTFEVTVNRKIKEAVLAMKIERTYSKDEILEMYLNQIYFGSGAYGVQAAAKIFFGKNARDLTISESALLAGLLKSPRNYSPLYHFDRSLQRRAVVLDAMADCDMITREEAGAIKATLVVLASDEEREKDLAPYFLEHVRRYLESRYTAERIYHDGLKVYTTLDPYLQRVAEDSMETHLHSIEASHAYDQTLTSYEKMLVEGHTAPPDYLQSAVIAIEPQTGYIRVMIGGRKFKHSQWNRAVQAKRQPGSAYKPFIYISAIENGYTPADIVLDAPIVIDLPNGDIYKPHNFSEKFLGEITLRTALNKSINVAAVRLLMALGPVSANNYAHKLGIKSQLQDVYSIALGSSEVTLMELTGAYAALAAGGVRAEPIAVTKVVDRDGRVLEENPVYREEVLSPQTSYIITNMLESALNEGTGISSRLMGFREIAAGKTGTTDDYTDALYLGFTNDLAVGVWTGFETKRTMGRGMTGARVSLPVWTYIMMARYRDSRSEPFPVPDGIVHRVICEESGLLSTSDCTHVRREVFVEGTEPRRACDAHEMRTFDRFSNKLR
jgi:penicillin-binding protein 1A